MVEESSKLKELEQNFPTAKSIVKLKENEVELAVEALSLALSPEEIDYTQGYLDVSENKGMRSLKPGTLVNKNGAVYRIIVNNEDYFKGLLEERGFRLIHSSVIKEEGEKASKYPFNKFDDFYRIEFI